jgi:hypothetical protein
MTTSDRDAITALIHEYAYRLDAGDLDGVARLLEHAVLSSAAGEVRDPASLYAAVIVYDDGTPRTMHQITNVTVEVDGERASARSYFTVLQVTGQGLHPVLAGEYRDTFARIDGSWRFATRQFVPILFGDLSRHLRRRGD